jgi:hypothetical protein
MVHRTIFPAASAYSMAKAATARPAIPIPGSNLVCTAAAEDWLVEADVKVGVLKRLLVFSAVEVAPFAVIVRSFVAGFID